MFTLQSKTEQEFQFFNHCQDPFVKYLQYVCREYEEVSGSKGIEYAEPVHILHSLFNIRSRYLNPTFAPLDVNLLEYNPPQSFNRYKFRGGKQNSEANLPGSNEYEGEFDKELLKNWNLAADYNSGRGRGQDLNRKQLCAVLGTGPLNGS